MQYNINNQTQTSLKHQMKAISRIENETNLDVSIFYNKYIVVNHIGRGTFGDIWGVRNKENPNEKYAMKMLRRDKICVSNRERYSTMFISEGKTIIKLNSIKTNEIGKEFIIKCIEILNDALNPQIVMELYGFSLLQYIQQNINISHIIPFQSIRFIATQLLSAMTFIHGVGAMVHADLKPANILVHYDDCINNQLYPRIKIIDFGNAMPLNKKVKVKSFNLQTIDYRAPEILCGNKDEISCLMDIWSIGCIIYELMNEKLLHHQSGDSVEKVVYKIYKTLESFPIYLYNKFKSINHQNEFQFDETLKSISYIRLKDYRKHKLMAKYNHYNDKSAEFDSFIDFVVCLLDVNPLTRYTSEDALKHPFIINDFALQKKVMQRNHHIIKSSNDNERQSRIDKQFKEYETAVNTQSNVDKANDSVFTEIIIKQCLY